MPSGGLGLGLPTAIGLQLGDQMALCRCGHSNNKPFCDGTHLTINFDGTIKN